MTRRTLSILMPCYNEQATLRAIVARVLAVPLPDLEVEIVLVDDGSQDGSVEIGNALAAEYPSVRFRRHPVNRGKGAAIRTAIGAAQGDIVLIQDADLEYDPADYSRLLEPILDGRADVVYGSRFVGGNSHRVLYYWHSLGNKFLTALSNMFTNLNLTDMEIGYKAFRREVLTRITLVEDRFGFEPEVTAKLARLKPALRFYEVGVSYAGRTYEQGKKIGWRDGLKAIYCIVRYNVLA